ncbi:hypothetical protein CVS40_8426 [Lucilia cuprina]|nr:hypothetical protein CVS40_8426 [Lucilia cuprina]
MKYKIVNKTKQKKSNKMFKFLALCLFAVIALAAAKPGIVAPLAYSAPVVAATTPYAAAYTTPYAAAYTAYSAFPYAASPYVAAPYTAAYSTYPYAASYLLRKIKGLFALCLFAIIALAAAKPGIVAPLAYSAPVVAAAPYTAAYTAPYAAAYTTPYAAAYSAYSAYPYVASPYAAAYSAYPYAASYVLRK